MRLKRTGRFLGKGAYKTCWVLSKRRVALISRNEDYGDVFGKIKDEYKLLRKLMKYKLPVINAKLEKIRHGTVTVEALVVPRYRSAGVRLDWMNTLQSKKFLPQIRKIRDRIEKLRIDINDMQFCLSKTKIVLADPLDITENVRPNLNDSLRELNDWIADVEGY